MMDGIFEADWLKIPAMPHMTIAPDAFRQVVDQVLTFSATT
jgi:hypothetical protein